MGKSLNGKELGNRISQKKMDYIRSPLHYIRCSWKWKSLRKSVKKV